MARAYTEGAEGHGTSNGATIVLGALVLYGFYEMALDLEHGVLEAVDGSDNNDQAEWLRRRPLLDELIFMNGSPDPDDDNIFRMLIERAVLYGGVTRVVLAKTIGVDVTTIWRWGKKGGHLPAKYERPSIVRAWRKLILGE